MYPDTARAHTPDHARHAGHRPRLHRSCNAAYVLWIAAQLLAGVLPLALAQAVAAAAAAAAAGAPGQGRPQAALGVDGAEGDRTLEAKGAADASASAWGPTILQVRLRRSESCADQGS